MNLIPLSGGLLISSFEAESSLGYQFVCVSRKGSGIYNHATSNLALRLNETFQDKLPEA